MNSQVRKPLFERLVAGLEEVIAHAKGERSLKTIEVQSDVMEAGAEDPLTPNPSPAGGEGS